jgi:TolB-like protein/DNA-binding winged helix-turn-helix (wHTH) protein
MPAPQAHLIHEFGDFELDPKRRMLLTRAGAPVDITGRVMDALIHLVERPGQLIEKKALMDALWPNVVVEDGNLTQTIHTLRRVLGEKAGEHRYIVTVPGRGYQFVAAVKTRALVAGEPGTPAPAPAPPSAPAQTLKQSPPAAQSAPTGHPAPTLSRRPRWVIAAGALAVLLLGVIAVFAWRGREQAAPSLTVNAHPSIAVLPFVDMSDEQDQVHFAEGLSEEILNLLAHADNLRVTARTSSFSFKGENVDIKTIAQRLEVAYVLEGSVRKQGDRLRITAQLIDASTSAHMWSDTYDRDVHDIFGVQREIAAAVADALRVTLARNSPRRAETMSSEAYEHYLQGRHLFNRRAGGDLAEAKAHFEKAVRIDPNYARAWSALAGVYFVGQYENQDFPDAMKRWGEAAERAITLDPELAEGHIRAAQYYMHERKQDLANANVARAQALDPNDPMVISITMSDAIVDGRLADAVEMQRRLVAMDPLSASQRGNLGLFLTMVDRLPEAQAQLERALELSPAGLATTAALSDVLILQGRADEAMAVIARIPQGYRHDERLAIAYYARGQTTEGDEILERLRAQAKDPHFDTGVALAIGEIHAARNEPDLAFEWLDRARPQTQRQLDEKPYWLLIEDLQVSPYLKSLHADPRWRDLMAKVRAHLEYLE